MDNSNQDNRAGLKKLKTDDVRPKTKARRPTTESDDDDSTLIEKPKTKKQQVSK